ncbi:virulence factor SrfB [Salinarimonas chemoclinalis]|uniref:virulence factor SrfB n=1 Tax=Salinarimonas chemoclinalis TaxID=3241599 RepID=UPI00355911A8
MLVKPVNPKETIVLAPHSGVQFVEYAIDFDAVGRFSRRFIERKYPDEVVDGDVVWRIFRGWSEENPREEWEDPHNPVREDDEVYEINREKALEPFLGRWVPVPYLRIRPGRGADGREYYDKGPTNWARVRVVEDRTKSPGEGPRHLAIFAFDTELAPERDTLEGATPFPYTAPIYADAENPHEFKFVSQMSLLGWFLGDPQEVEGLDERVDYQAWVLDWVRDLFVAFKKASKNRTELREGDLPYKLEHAARWFAFMELLNEAVPVQNVRLADTISEQLAVKPIDVDLVLDVGNSRTCGILIEKHQGGADLSDARVLELRDIARPEHVYAEPFESRVELAQAWFGDDFTSRQSGRSRAFYWPSLVRVGPEASRLRAQQEGTEGVGGMSSPKRYLWDVTPVNQEWRFPKGDYGKDGIGPPVERAVRSMVNPMGDVLSQLATRKADLKLFDTLHGGRRKAELRSKMGARLTFSRSSFYTLMLVEVIWQTWVMINSERFRGERREKATPRRLRRIVLTLPSATPVREQRIMMARANAAIDLIWDLTGWRQKAPPGVVPPVVQVAWDEATCVQFVWLYGQIARNFGGQIREFFELVGRPRIRCEADKEPPADRRPEPSLRVASIDIGGGTTDLMVITYFEDDNTQINPVQTFREGFRVAGDDVVRAIIEALVLPAIADSMAEAGVRGAREILTTKFAGGRAGVSEQEKQLRRQFVLRVLEPVALGLLHAYEQAGADAYETVETRLLVDFLPDGGEGPPDAIRGFVEDAARAAGGDGFDILSVPVSLAFGAMRAAITAELDKVFDNIAEAVHHFDCDMVLVSGRPSRLPAVMEMLIDRLAVPPDRVLPLHAFRAGDWYPFRGRDNRSIADPKTAVVVGATLCLLAEHQLQNFRLATESIQMRSTARYIGRLELGRQLREENVLFRFSDLEKPGAAPSATLRWFAVMQLGYRQLPFERWLGSPLYQLSYEASDRPEPPIEVTLEREPPDADPETADARLDAEAAKEDLRLTDASDKSGMGVKAKMSLTFRTMPVGDSYWLDTGVVKVL